MDKTALKKYLNNLEENVILPFAQNGLAGTNHLVSSKPGKLYTTSYGRTLGLLLLWDDIVVVDYYGFHKKSIGFIRKAEEVQRRLKKSHVSIRVPVISFASIHLEHILKYKPEIVSDFPEFKLSLLELRGFTSREGVND